MSEPDQRAPLPPTIDTSVAHPARRYDYWLGGTVNFAADRASGDAIAKVFPHIRTAIIENRRFLRRAVRHLTGELGVRQFLDIGTGIPSADNTHEVAQAIAPETRVVYVDNDPIVLHHARGLLTGMADGATTYLDADVRYPEKILNHPDLVRVLDLTQPVALMLIAVLHFVEDTDDPYGTVARLIDALPSGSYLAMTHATADFMPPAAVDGVLDDARTSAPFRFRTRDEFARFLDGLELVEPGIVSYSEWRAENEEHPRPSPMETAGYGAIARIR